MSYEHSNVYIIRINDAMTDGTTNVWFAGPYGSTRADQVADQLDTAQFGSKTIECRTTYVEPLFSNNDCLVVKDYGRAEQGSLT